MMTPEEKGALPLQVEKLFYDLQDRIFADVVRRIKKTGQITSTADWQISRLTILGNSSEYIESELKRMLDATYPEIWELYDKVQDMEYVRYEDVYSQINRQFVPLEDNDVILQLGRAIEKQTENEIRNITQSLGMSVDMGRGKTAFTPLAEYYQKYLDRACMDIATGAFDYNTVLRRVVKELAASGLRTISYASGHVNRATVAARRAILTGVSQLSGHINEMVARDLGTNVYEVSWHSGHRPDHWWGGRVYTYEQLQSVCKLGEGSGLCGWNCRHSYYPFIPGISVRNYTDEELREMEAHELETKVWNGKEYNAYEITQKQRQMETAMRAQRQKVRLLQEGKADRDDITLAKAKYQLQLKEYAAFSRKMGVEEQRERIYIDGLGRVATNTKKQNAAYTEQMIRNASKDRAQYERYRKIIGKDAGTLAEFRKMKYNAPKGLETLEALKEEALKNKSFEELGNLLHCLTNREVRIWYVAHTAKIPDMLDPNGTMEEKAFAAFELRNKTRTQARLLMSDMETKKKLDKDRPNKTFEELVTSKMERKRMTREEAIKDIYRTATETNANVNKDLGIGGG